MMASSASVLDCTCSFRSITLGTVKIVIDINTCKTFGKQYIYTNKYDRCKFHWTRKKLHSESKECLYKFNAKINIKEVRFWHLWGPVHTWALRTSFSSLSLSVTASLWARTCWKRKQTKSDRLIWREKTAYMHVQWNQKNNYKLRKKFTAQELCNFFLVFKFSRQ